MVRNNYSSSMDSSFNDQGNYNKMNDVNALKSNLRLNLQDGPDNFRRTKCSFNSPTVLLSPDVRKFKLTTPDIEKFFKVGSSKTPTPSSPLLFPKDPVEAYPSTLDSLNNFETDSSQNNNYLQLELQRNNNANNNRNSTESSSNSFMNIDNPYNSVLPTVVLPEFVTVKDEPQTVPSLNSSPNMSPIPIDMETQEAFKLQRKRQRNRVAASKCRKRKLERIAKLEDKVKFLKSENHDLVQMLTKLKVEVYNLKEKVMKHCDNGCNIYLP